MNNSASPADLGRVFKTCVRCGYSLRGLPASHRCPECGLRFDERCALYRVANPKQLFAIWLMILGGGWVNVKRVPHLGNLAGASTWETVGALAGVLWIVLVIAGVWFFASRYRRGLVVAITTDGLIVRLPGFKDDLIPWHDIDSASIKSRPAGKPQVARLFIKGTNKTVDLGGVANVFPTRTDVEQFVRQVSERLEAADDEGNSCASSRSDTADARDPRVK